MKSPVGDDPLEVQLAGVPLYIDTDQVTGAVWVLMEPGHYESVQIDFAGCAGRVPADGKWHRLKPLQPYFVQRLVFADYITPAVVAEAFGLDPAAVRRLTDPDYDVTGPLDAIDAHIAYEQRVAGDARAIRQTEQWKNRQTRPDPTDILDNP